MYTWINLPNVVAEWWIVGYSDGVKFLGYFRANTEPLCIELCDFVQCRILVNCLILCLYFCVVAFSNF
jgi:hypothetical protein